MKKILNSQRTFVAAILIGVAIIVISAVSGPVSRNFEISKNLDIFAEVYKQLNINYVEQIEPGDLMKSGIDAMLGTLDPYTNYFPESQLEDFMIMATGQYGGIGSLIHQRGEQVEIGEPYEGFPAQRVGLQAGDIILEVNNIDVRAKKSEEVSTLLKGQAGTAVKVKVMRGKKTLTFEMTRQEITIPNIPFSGMLENNIGYIQLSGFTQNAGREVKDAFLELKKHGDIKGLIIDLRGNGGGLLHEAVNIVNIFVPKGKIVVTTKGKLIDKNQIYRTLNEPVDTQIPLAILIDESSASASEIVAGAIQDLDRGIVIGQKSFGKGLVQNVVPLSYNSRLKVTVAKYYIPSGRCIQAIDYSVQGHSKKMADSLATVYKTAGGRLVYDVGGIRPDVQIDPEYLSIVTSTLLSKYLIFDFATEYYSKHSEIKSISTLMADSTVFSDFKLFIAGKDYSYTTTTEKNLDNLKTTLEGEGYFNDLSGEYDALVLKMKHSKVSDVDKFKKEISLLLKAEIASRYWFAKGRIQAQLDGDPSIDQAGTILLEEKSYQAILKPKKN